MAPITPDTDREYLWAHGIREKAGLNLGGAHNIGKRHQCSDQAENPVAGHY